MLLELRLPAPTTSEPLLTGRLPPAGTAVPSSVTAGAYESVFVNDAFGAEAKFVRVPVDA